MRQGTHIIHPVNPMAAEAKDTVTNVMRRDRDNFTRLVSDPKNWNVMTRCVGWEVRDLVGHLIDVTEGYFKNWDAANKGYTPTPAGLDVMGETLNDHALEFRKLSRDEALDRFMKDAQKFDSMLAALTPEEWTGFLVSDPYAGPVPAGFYGTFQIMDYAVHSYDIEYGLGNKLATIDEASAGLILPFAFIFWQYEVDQKAAAGLATQYGVEVAGPWGGKWRITVKDGKWSPVEEKGNFEGCDARFRFNNAADLVLTFFQRFPGGAAVGDPLIIDRVRRLHFQTDGGGSAASYEQTSSQHPTAHRDTDLVATEFPDLAADEISRIRFAVREWARFHPSPETPVLQMLDGSVMTPRDIADGLDEVDTPRGRTIYRMFAVIIRGAKESEALTLSQVLAPFEADLAAWRRS